MSRALNFGAGPAILPEAVLQQAAAGVLELGGSGMSVLEISHRGPEYAEIHADAKARLLRLLRLPASEFDVLFLGGGASLQFLMVPMNFLGPNDAAGYIDTGTWARKALSEARRIGAVSVLASSEDATYSRLPVVGNVPGGLRYVHVTTNNTIEGTQWADLPDVGDTPLVADASSDFLSMSRDHARLSLMYAGAQKNAGPAGVTVIVARRAFLDSARADLPSMLSYRLHAAEDSLYNTPPVFGVYIVGLVCRWIEDQGGLAAIGLRNREKARIVYAALDASPDVYEPTVTAPEDRSLMNITFRLRDASREVAFLAGAERRGMIGLRGHRSVGGFRASVYNAFPLDGVREFAEYLVDFASGHAT